MGKRRTRLGWEPVATWAEGGEPDTEVVIARVKSKLDDVAKRLETVPDALAPILVGQTART